MPPKKKRGAYHALSIDVSPFLAEAPLPELYLPTVLDLIQYGRYNNTNIAKTLKS